MTKTALGLGFLLLLTQAAGAEPPSQLPGEKAGEVAAHVAKLVGRLDSDRFEIRSRAAEEIEWLIERPEAATALAAEFSRISADPQASFEVRAQVRAWTKRLPAAKVTAETSDANVQSLLRETESDSFATRSFAAQRLASLADQPQSAVALMMQLRERLTDSALMPDDYRRLLVLYERARGTWLMSDPAQWKMPPVEKEQLDAAVAQLESGNESQGAVIRQHAAARRCLLDCMCQDEVVPRVKAALEARLESAALNAQGRERLSEVLEWTRPALVAEIWQGRQQISEQNLLVDVARTSQWALRPSHFSRIDDHTATCVSGQNLTPGEYPVGLAIAHPSKPGWMCHLVNLPTPRRRMQYPYHAKRDEQQRLAELTERTLQAYIANKTYLTDLQILLLQELHPATVSRLIGDYFLAVDDGKPEESTHNVGGQNVSHHGRICYVLALIGTHEVAPGFLEALRKQRFQPPAAEDAPYAFAWPWIAGLAIVRRDPWLGANDWLVSLIDRREPLIVEQEAVDENGRKKPAAGTPLPELGATAAALLLDRYDQSPESFGLEEIEASVLRNIGCPAYRFTTSTGRQDVLRWWAGQRKQDAQREKTP